MKAGRSGWSFASVEIMLRSSTASNAAVMVGLGRSGCVVAASWSSILLPVAVELLLVSKDTAALTTTQGTVLSDDR